MAIAKLLLGVDSTVTPHEITATAIDDNLISFPSGILVTGPNKKINWVHQAAGQTSNFVVEFRLKKNDPTTAGWPFQGQVPSDKKLRVPPNGIQTKLRNNTNTDWHYVVALGTLELDPMIIIRGKKSRMHLVLAAIGGALVGAVVTCLLRGV